jgi:hypothetical protein
VIKTMEVQVGQFLLVCKCLVSRLLPGRAKDLSAISVKANLSSSTFYIAYFRTSTAVVVVGDLDPEPRLRLHCSH